MLRCALLLLLILLLHGIHRWSKSLMCTKMVVLLLDSLQVGSNNPHQI